MPLADRRQRLLPEDQGVSSHICAVFYVLSWTHVYSLAEALSAERARGFPFFKWDGQKAHSPTNQVVGLCI